MTKVESRVPACAFPRRTMLAGAAALLAAPAVRAQGRFPDRPIRLISLDPAEVRRRDLAEPHGRFWSQGTGICNAANAIGTE